MNYLNALHYVARYVLMFSSIVCVIELWAVWWGRLKLAGLFLFLGIMAITTLWCLLPWSIL